MQITQAGPTSILIMTCPSLIYQSQISSLLHRRVALFNQRGQKANNAIVTPIVLSLH